MPKHFPDRVDPWRLVEREQIIQGRIALVSMGRLLTLLNDRGGTEEASFRLSFYRNQERRAVIRCEISATLSLTCQRCLGLMSVPVEIDSMLALVDGLEEAERLPEELEPLMLTDEGLLQVRELLEDELLLAVPDAPKHREKDCVLKTDGFTDVPAAENAQAKANPFDILAVLKDGAYKR